MAFGITERFDKALIHLKRQLRWSRQPHYVRTNTGHDRPSKEEIPPRVRERIREQNRLDIQLYEMAAEQFDEKVGGAPNFQKEVHQFQQKKTALSAIGSLFASPYRHMSSLLSS
jgi:hypothetical protein